MVVRKQSNRTNSKPVIASSDVSANVDAIVHALTMRLREKELEPNVKKICGGERVRKSSNLVFCTGEAEAYMLEQLMWVSTEMLNGDVGMPCRYLCGVGTPYRYSSDVSTQ
ncbi:hypothetical protein L1049_023400 [Liquidambar formosana]|uniref:Uncharacterized protein n=1 Tax=Liquidambar formosana TaxID=63359 RepID=A0AAP0X0J2_LIQFO